MNLDKKHFLGLKNSYQKVSNKVIDQNDFKICDLEISRSFFKKKSLLNLEPEPIDVDVYAVLSGISFENNFLNFIEIILEKINLILIGHCYYLVKKENLGVEYAVIKWPDQTLNKKVLKESRKIIENSEIAPFFLKVFGIQLHPDGCIILKCVDERKEIFNLREKLINNVKGIPKKQSSWAHIPLGRILSPVGSETMKKLKRLITEIDNDINHNLLINSVHIVHEQQWYMEKKDYLFTKNLNKRS